MKKILIVEKEIPEIKSKKVIIKKNKTIIKDLNIIEDENFLGNLVQEGIPYKFMVEEWEVMNTERIQLVMANDGSQLRPIHICSDLYPKNGIKALFQSEKMLIIRAQNGIYEISKNVIREDNTVFTNVIKIGNFSKFEDIKNQIESNFQPAVESLIKKYDKYLKDGYLSAVWGNTI
jgi:hypothetical protein